MLYCGTLNGAAVLIAYCLLALVYFSSLFIAKKKMSSEDTQQFKQLYGQDSETRTRIELSTNLIVLLFKYKTTSKSSSLLKYSQRVAQTTLFIALAALVFTTWLEVTCS